MHRGGKKHNCSSMGKWNERDAALQKGGHIKLSNERLLSKPRSSHCSHVVGFDGDASMPYD